jgi:hypothetical protein
MIMSRGRPSPVRAAPALLALASTLLLAGCVHRQFTVTTSPPGAIVQVNGKTIGATPVDVPFTYYGTYRLTLLRDGYQTMVVDQPVPAPWYQYFPLEFISEHLIPWTIRDQRRFHFDLFPLQVLPPEAALDRAGQLRSQGQVIGLPVAGPVAPVTVPTQRPPTEPETLPIPNPVPPGGIGPN